ncbi:4-hydroxybutyrate CoA-transferase [bacterium]|nr:4-hydroxybutyrate CoA-transferase [bacterium]
MSWQKRYQEKLVTHEEAAKSIKSGDTISVPGACAVPYKLLNAVGDRWEELEDVTVATVLYMDMINFLEGKYKGHIGTHSVFIGPLERFFIEQGNVKVTSCNLSLCKELFQEVIGGNVVAMEVSPPDEWGYMSYGPVGTSVNASLVEPANRVIVQVNDKVPYVYGKDACIHVDEVEMICEFHHALPVLPDIPVDDNDRKMAEYIVERIPNGATIQIGIGPVANAIGFFLDQKKDLGIHTEMLTDSMMHLAKKGIINGSKKTFYPGKITFGFGIGSQELYDFMNRNPKLEAMPIYDINNINNIAMNDNYISINNALSVDLTGQVASETLGHSLFSCTGGQHDFVMGAALSKGGKSFIALNSVAKTEGGLVSRITSALPLGTVVTTPRSIVRYVVTEHGIADLWLKSVDERVKQMITIAHPDFRDQLEKEARDAGLLPKEVW